jgi:hypothetical protein
VYVTVKNVFDETFQAPMALRGNLEISVARKPEIRKTTTLLASDILEARGYSSATGILTMDPGDSMRLGYSWNFIDDSGFDIRRGVLQMIVDSLCKVRCISLEETLILKGEIKVYERTAPVKFGPTAFTFCYVTNWVNTRECSPVFPDSLCGLRQFPPKADTCKTIR